MQKLAVNFSERKKTTCFKIEIDFKEYTGLIGPFKIDKTSENVLNNYLNNQNKDNSILNYIPMDLIKNFIILMSKSLAFTNSKKNIALKEVQCSLIVLDYIKSLNNKKSIIKNDKGKHLFFSKLDNLFFNKSNQQKLVNKSIHFSENALKFIETLKSQIENDLRAQSKKKKKKRIKGLLDEIIGSIKFLALIINFSTKKNIEKKDIIDCVLYLYKFLFQIPHIYYFTLFDIYRLNFSEKYQELVKTEVSDEIISKFRKSDLYNTQRLIGKVYPPKELRNIGVNNQPISNLISFLFKLKTIQDRGNKIKNNINFNIINQLLNEIIINFNFKNREFGPTEEQKETNSVGNKVSKNFLKYGFKKSFTLSSLNFLSYFKNFINNVLESIFGRKNMLFYYSSLTQQIISFIVSLSLIDNFHSGEKKVTEKNICMAIRMYTYLFLDL
ncbi:MAG: hypothetical protein GF329_11375 [Candidatus Lokiarchaeota archaeon]|nr:hypothetical protein [Candidatus Lokiarchaeota archaeon]